MLIIGIEQKSGSPPSLGLTPWRVTPSSGQTTLPLWGENCSIAATQGGLMRGKTSGRAPHSGLALHKWLEVGVTKSSILSLEGFPKLVIPGIGLMWVTILKLFGEVLHK